MRSGSGPTSTGSAAPPRRSSSSSTGPRWRARSTDLLDERRGAERLPAARGHPRRPAGAHRRGAASVRRLDRDRPGGALPERDPRRRQVALLRGEHAGDADRRGPRRRRGRLRPPGRDRARGADLVDLLGRRRTARCGLPRSTSASSTRSPATSSIEAIDVEEGAFGRDDAARRPRGLPRVDQPRDPADLGRRRGRAAESSAAPAPRRRKRVLAEAVEAERAAATA